MIQGFGQDIVEIPAFGHDITEVRAMGELVWQKSIPDYLCFTALESGTFTLTIPAAVTPTYLSYIEWSKDGRTWNHRDNSSDIETIPVDVAQGEKVYWRGSGNRCTADTTVATSALNVSSDARFDASGHLLSILKGDDYENVSGVQRYTFCNLFYQNTALVHAHDLVLPPVGLTGVFFQLFRGCSSLVSPPASIPLTTIPAWGCRGMYYDCSSLITPTDLIATTYGNTACTFMYRGCASLTRIAALPTVTSLVDSAQFQQMYYGCTSLTRAELYTVTAPFKKQLFSAMFYRCTNLSYIKCLYTDLSADQAFTDWLSGVSSTGTFIQAEGVTWPRGASGIPSGWIINPDYLCFTALDNNTQFTFTKYINLLNTNLPSISYSMDGGDTWTEVAMSGSGNEDIVTTPAVNAGGKVLWKAEAARFALAPDKYSTFTANGRFNVSGNIMSLLYGDNHYDKTDTRAYTYSFGPLFRDSTNLIDASQLKLPTGHMNAADLLGLFLGCTNLVHGAPLYAPNIPDSCCYNMYRDCTSMTEMPTIAATSMLKDDGTTPSNYGLYYTFYHCSNMEGEVKLNIVGDVGQQVLDACFTNCSKITSADLAFNGALGKMALRGAFVGCTSLSHVKCLATSFYDDGTAANGSLYNWMNNVSSTGTFIQASGVTWPRGKSGIPTNWTIETQTT